MKDSDGVAQDGNAQVARGQIKAERRHYRADVPCPVRVPDRAPYVALRGPLGGRTLLDCYD